MRNIALLTALLVVLGAVPVLAQSVPITPSPMLPAPGGTLPGGAPLTPAPPGQSSLPAPGGTLPGATAELTPVTK